MPDFPPANAPPPYPPPKNSFTLFQISPPPSPSQTTSLNLITRIPDLFRRQKLLLNRPHINKARQ